MNCSEMRIMMRKVMKKLIVFLASVTVAGSLTGCSAFDASGYVNAILNNAYYNDSVAIVEQQAATAEEALVVYEAGMKAKLDATLADVLVSDELYQDYIQLYKDLYANAKFTVGEAVKIDDETFEVTVSYEKMQVFSEAIADYEVEVADFVNKWTESTLSGGEKPSDEEMNDYLFTKFKECIGEAMTEISYANPQTMVIKVELQENVWVANQEDLLALENSLFDFESLYGGTE